jgi:hypothetical protein
MEGVDKQIMGNKVSKICAPSSLEFPEVTGTLSHHTG